MHRLKQLVTVAGGWLLLVTAGVADTYPLPPDDVDLVGEMQVARARHEDTLLDVARRYDIGQEEILHANPDVDRWLPGDGTEVLIPSRYILPRTERRGIVLNVPEMRLYYYPKPDTDGRRLVITHPVSIGRMDWDTPLGTTRVVRKDKDPAWRPPESIRKEAEERGEPLPEIVPPGPDNPLGRFALRLGVPGYLIHSTNKPYGVGMRVTHGCVRMYPEDIERLFDLVPVNERVEIINQPVKAGWFADTLFLEVHPPLEEERGDPRKLIDRAMEAIEQATEGRNVRLSGSAIRRAVTEQRGYPVPVSR